MPETDAAGVMRGRHATTAFGRYLVYLAALLAGVVIMFVMLLIYLSVYMTSSWVREYRGYLGYNVIDSGTPWQWTFNIMLWGLPALPVCRWILGFFHGSRPGWSRLIVGYVVCGFTVYALGLLAYNTDIDRAVLVAAGVFMILTAGYVFTSRWIVSLEKL